MNTYQKGAMQEYETLMLTSHNSDRFDILYEFPNESGKLIENILNSLNAVRELSVVG